MQEILEKIKLALRVVTDAFDDELTDLINAGLADLEAAGIDKAITGSIADYPLALTALKTYCRLYFGEPEDPERLEKSYAMQVAQLASDSDYIGRVRPSVRGGRCG